MNLKKNNNSLSNLLNLLLLLILLYFIYQYKINNIRKEKYTLIKYLNERHITGDLQYNIIKNLEYQQYKNNKKDIIGNKIMEKINPELYSAAKTLYYGGILKK